MSDQLFANAAVIPRLAATPSYRTDFLPLFLHIEKPVKKAELETSLCTNCCRRPSDTRKPVIRIGYVGLLP